MAADSFRWQDGERLIRFGRGTLAEAPELLGEGYALLTTPRHAGAAPDVVERAVAVHHVEPGRVDELAAILRPDVEGDRLVALGGGRVIDVAKALAAADPPRHVAAIPTTLSAAEMTPLHRHATGVPADTPHVRAAIVLNDPAVCASQPVPDLAASALNSLGHAAEGPLTPLSNPVSALAAYEAARLLTSAFAHAEPDRDALALGALLAGYSISSTGYGLHHVMAQTAVRLAGVGHGPSNAILLPHTLAALRRRFPERMETFDAACGGDAIAAADAILSLTGFSRLRDLDVPAERLADLADAAAERRELALTPPAADRDELLALYETAW